MATNLLKKCLQIWKWALLKAEKQIAEPRIILKNKLDYIL